MVRKKEPKLLTLAIGDGTNDVSMIKMAHVGIGIKGLEGTEAASNSDYSIGTFKHTKRLLLGHGRNFAFKMDYYVYKFMFKNLITSLTATPIGFISGFSGMNNYNNTYVAGISIWMYNLDCCQWIMADQDIPFRYYNTR